MADADQRGQCDHQRRGAEEQDGVDRRLVARMKAGKPFGQEVVPACDHRQAGAHPKKNAERREVVDKEKQNRRGHDEAGEPEGLNPAAQGLCDRSDHVLRRRWDEGENGAGGEDIDQSNDRPGEQNRARQVAFRIAALTGENGDVFEAGESAERHLAEDAQSEQRKGRRDQAQGVVLRELPCHRFSNGLTISRAIVTRKARLATLLIHLPMFRPRPAMNIVVAITAKEPRRSPICSRRSTRRRG